MPSYGTDFLIYKPDTFDCTAHLSPPPSCRLYTSKDRKSNCAFTPSGGENLGAFRLKTVYVLDFPNCV